MSALRARFRKNAATPEPMKTMTTSSFASSFIRLAIAMVHPQWPASIACYFPLFLLSRLLTVPALPCCFYPLFQVLLGSSVV
jgi:hypothetical protein